MSGHDTGVSDLDIAIVTRRHGTWQMCGIRGGDEFFGPLPGPLE
ncbi:hypothetical protein ABZ319_33270 [Nocardia sp. NPDC005978]